MSALIILALYAAAGLLAALYVLVLGQAGPARARLGQALATLVLWPFLLPVHLAPRDSRVRPASAPDSARARRLDEVAGRLEECWRQAAVESPWAAQQAREHRLLEGFITRLRAQLRRLADMEEALRGAPPSVKERLGRLHQHAADELERNIGLVEELAAQLTLLRFASLGEPSAVRVERGHVEELLARIEALAEASQPASPEAPATPVARA